MTRASSRVSVIVPLFNRRAYIEQTLQSILQQDHDPVELIVVDDGSTDGGDAIADAYARAGQLTLLRHEHGANKGPAASINLGLRHATGAFIAILDSDDLFTPGKLAQQVAFLESHPEVGLVYGNGCAIDAAGRFLHEIRYEAITERSDPNDVLLDCYFLLPQNALVRAEVYESVGGFDESLRSGQDHDMLIRMAEVTTFAQQPIDAFRYRRHADSISFQQQVLRWRCALVVLEKAIKRYPYRRDVVRRRRALVNFKLAAALLEQRSRFPEVIGRLAWAGLLHPSKAWSVLVELAYGRRPLIGSPMAYDAEAPPLTGEPVQGESRST